MKNSGLIVRIRPIDRPEKTTAQQLGRLVEIPTERRAVAWIGQPAKADFVHYSKPVKALQLFAKLENLLL